MAKKLGANYRLFVKDETGTGFSQPKVQGDLTINRNASDIDTSTKDTGEYGTSENGQKTLSITQNFVPDLPDALGYSRMKALDSSRETTTYQIREKPFAVEDVVFECVMSTLIGSTDLGNNKAVNTAATLKAAEAPTVDEI